MKKVLESIDYIDKQGVKRNRLTTRLIYEDTFQHYKDMVADFQEPEFQVNVISCRTINQKQKEEILKKDDGSIIPIRIHSNYLSIHMDIDSFYNNRVKRIY